MSEGNPVAVNAENQITSKPRTLMIVGGTTVALLIAGIAYQFIRPSEDGVAAEQTGRASVGARPIEGAAKVTKAGRSIQIPLRDLYEECARRVGNEVLDSMINRAIIQLACEEGGVTVTEPEVEREIIRIAKQFNIPVETWLQMLQTERNITPGQYSRDVIWPMLALKKLAGGGVDVTEQDMQKAFLRNYGPKVKCRMIMLEDIRKANEVWQKARLKPTDFERLAGEYSRDINSRALGGSIPPIARYSGNPEIEKAAFRLKPDEISSVIQVGVNQFVILKCEGYTKQIVTDIKEVQEQLHTDLSEQKVQESVAVLFEKLKDQTRIDNYWNGTTSGDIRQVSGRTKSTGRVKQAAGTRQPSQKRPASGTQKKTTGRRPATR